VAYFPDGDLADGAAADASQFFFDCNNRPPEDTWVWFAHHMRIQRWASGTEGMVRADFLVAWIPPDFVKLADAGIDANPEQCIQRLDTLDIPFVKHLRELKLME
jgi:hypothetical protein